MHLRETKQSERTRRKNRLDERYAPLEMSTLITLPAWSFDMLLTSCQSSALQTLMYPSNPHETRNDPATGKSGFSPSPPSLVPSGFASASPLASGSADPPSEKMGKSLNARGRSVSGYAPAFGGAWKNLRSEMADL